MINERHAGPLFADLGKEAVLDGILFGSDGGIMADRDEDSEGVSESLLQSVLPQVGIGAVAAAVVGEDEQAGGLGVAVAAIGNPPAADRLGGKAWCVAGDPDVDAAAIGLELVDAVGNSNALAEGTEIVVEDLDGLAAPNPAGILEVADQFALLGVDVCSRRGCNGAKGAPCTVPLQRWATARAALMPPAPIWGPAGSSPRIHRYSGAATRTRGRPARSSRRIPWRLRKRRKSSELIRRPRVSR
jgi:hypothetical protein